MTLPTRSFELSLKMPDLNEFMTTEEAAKELGFTVKSIRNMIYRDALPHRKFGRALLIPKQAIQDYKEKTKGMSKNDPRRGKAN